MATTRALGDGSTTERRRGDDDGVPMTTGGATWVTTLPAFVVLSAVLFGPGWLVVRALGSRGLEALAVSPAVSAGLVAAAATLAQRAGIRWGWVPFAVATATAVVAAGLIDHGAGRVVKARVGRAQSVLGSTRRLMGRPDLDAVVGIGIGVVLALVTILPAMEQPNELVDSPDAVYHLNRIRLFLETGNFSIANDSFYPNGFHAWIATSLLSGVVDVLAGTNVATIILAAVVWPIGCVALVRHALGTSRLVTYAAGLASAAFLAFPSVLLGWGVLWPNLMGTALTPGALAIMLQAARSKRVGQWLGFLATLPGLALIQPNSLVALGVFAIAWFVASRVRAGILHHRSWPRVARDLLAVAIVVSVGLVVAPLVSTRLASTQSFEWTNRVPITTALVEVVGGRLLVPSVSWGLVVLLPIGIWWIATRARRAMPVVVLWLTCVMLYVVAAWSTADWTSLVTGYWYNDKVRLASLAAVPGVVIVAAAAPAFRVALRHLTWLRGRPAGTALVSLVVLPLLTVAWPHGIRATMLEDFFHPRDPTHVILSAAAQRDLARLAADIPPGEGVVGRPENGSPLMYAMFGTNTVYRSIPIPTTGDDAVIGTGFDEMAARPEVCQALRRNKIRWAIDSSHVYWLDRPERSSGLIGLGGVDGLQEAARSGDYTLYRITGCG